MQVVKHLHWKKKEDISSILKKSSQQFRSYWIFKTLKIIGFFLFSHRIHTKGVAPAGHLFHGAVATHEVRK